MPEQFALVEPPPPAPPPVQWHRDNSISPEVPNFSRGPLHPCLAHRFRQSLIARMLHPKHKFAQHPIIRSQPGGELEGEALASALRAAVTQIGVRSNRAAAPRAGR